MFELDPRLIADTLPAGRLSLCQLRLMNDSRYPWFILVPERPGLTDVFEMVPPDQHLLIEEITAVSRAVDRAFAPDKVNTAWLGNVVKQLHIHVVGRFVTDPTWPRPVWGIGAPVMYPPGAAQERIVALQGALGRSS